MRYEVETTAGYKFVFRSVLEMKIDAERRSVFLQMPGLKYTVHGFTTIKGGGDLEPWGKCMEIIPPSCGSATAIPLTVAAGLVDVRPDAEPFRREEQVPVELLTTTFAPIEKLVPCQWRDGVGYEPEEDDKIDGPYSLNDARAIFGLDPVPASIPLENLI